jgi:acyl-CoA synthetase (NDP forming)
MKFQQAQIKINKTNIQLIIKRGKKKINKSTKLDLQTATKRNCDNLCNETETGRNKSTQLARLLVEQQAKRSEV